MGSKLGSHTTLIPEVCASTTTVHEEVINPDFKDVLPEFIVWLRNQWYILIEFYSVQEVSSLEFHNASIEKRCLKYSLF